MTLLLLLTGASNAPQFSDTGYTDAVVGVVTAPDAAVGVLTSPDAAVGIITAPTGRY